MCYDEPDFMSAKSALEELFENTDHYCIFYPKFHCELNFIEQVWGAAKRMFRELPRARNEAELEANVLLALSNVSTVLMHR